MTRNALRTMVVALCAAMLLATGAVSADASTAAVTAASASSSAMVTTVAAAPGEQSYGIYAGKKTCQDQGKMLMQMGLIWSWRCENVFLFWYELWIVVRPILTT